MLTTDDKKRWIIDPYDVKPKDFKRIHAWAHGVISKHEHLLKNEKYKVGKIIARDGLKPEDLDVQQFYPFKGLWWLIYKVFDNHWGFRLMAKRTVLFEIVYKKI